MHKRELLQGYYKFRKQQCMKRCGVHVHNCLSLHFNYFFFLIHTSACLKLNVNFQDLSAWEAHFCCAGGCAIAQYEMLHAMMS